MTVTAPVILVDVAVVETRSVPKVVVRMAVVFEQQFVLSVDARQQYSPGLHCSTFHVKTLPESVVARESSGVSRTTGRVGNMRISKIP